MVELKSACGMMVRQAKRPLLGTAGLYRASLRRLSCWVCVLLLFRVPTQAEEAIGANQPDDLMVRESTVLAACSGELMPEVVRETSKKLMQELKLNGVHLAAVQEARNSVQAELKVLAVRKAQLNEASPESGASTLAPLVQEYEALKVELRNLEVERSITKEHPPNPKAYEIGVAEARIVAAEQELKMALDAVEVQRDLIQDSVVAQGQVREAQARAHIQEARLQVAKAELEALRREVDAGDSQETLAWRMREERLRHQLAAIQERMGKHQEQAKNFVGAIDGKLSIQFQEELLREQLSLLVKEEAQLRLKNLRLQAWADAIEAASASPAGDAAKSQSDATVKPESVPQ